MQVEQGDRRWSRYPDDFQSEQLIDGYRQKELKERRRNKVWQMQNRKRERRNCRFATPWFVAVADDDDERYIPIVFGTAISEFQQTSSGVDHHAMSPGQNLSSIHCA